MRITTLFLLLAAVSAASAATYKIDPAHSGASFAVTHMLVSTVRGQFSNVTGTVDYDPAKPGMCKIDARIDATTVNTQQAKRDAHLRSEDFFDVAKFPAMTFQSTSCTMTGGKLQVAGQLTIHGVTRPVVLAVSGPKPEVKTGTGATIGASATTKVSRRAFGLTWNKLMETGGAVVGDDVEITLDIEANRI